MNTTQNPAGLTGLAATVIVWIALLLGVEIPAEVAAAISGLLAAAVSYFTPRSAVDQIPADEGNFAAGHEDVN